jgi:hypothetical protein
MSSQGIGTDEPSSMTCAIGSSLAPAAFATSCMDTNREAATGRCGWELKILRCLGSLGAGGEVQKASYHWASGHTPSCLAAHLLVGFSSIIRDNGQTPLGYRCGRLVR